MGIRDQLAVALQVFLDESRELLRCAGDDFIAAFRLELLDHVWLPGGLLSLGARRARKAGA